MVNENEPDEPISDDILDAYLAGKTIGRFLPLREYQIGVPTTRNAIILGLAAGLDSKPESHIGFEAGLTVEQATSLAKALLYRGGGH